MRRMISAVSTAALVVGVVVPSIAFSAAMYPKGKGNIANGKAIYENGKGSVPACASCHGADGMGDDNMGTPRLAGQYAVFLRKQLEDYATDKRKDNTMFVMNDNAKGLSAQDRTDVSTYMESISTGSKGKMAFAGSDLKELAANGVDVGVPHKGKTIVLWGKDKGGRGEVEKRAVARQDREGLRPLDQFGRVPPQQRVQQASPQQPSGRRQTTVCIARFKRR